MFRNFKQRVIVYYNLYDTKLALRAVDQMLVLQQGINVCDKIISIRRNALLHLVFTENRDPHPGLVLAQVSRLYY